MTWKVVFTKYAQKDARKLANGGIKNKAKTLIEILRINPFQNPPSYGQLVGDLSGCYSRRINIQHRLVYQVIESENTVKVLRMWSHYE